MDVLECVVGCALFHLGLPQGAAAPQLVCSYACIAATRPFGVLIVLTISSRVREVGPPFYSQLCGCTSKVPLPCLLLL